MISTTPHHFRKLTKNEIIHILNNSEYCLLGTSNNDQSYIVPMDYKYFWDEQRCIFMMYTLSQGQKMNNMHGNSKVCLEFNYQLPGKMQTVVAMGTVKMKPISSVCNDSASVYKLMISIDKISGREYKIRPHH